MTDAGERPRFLLLATAAEAGGAARRVAGLPVGERALRQLATQRGAAIIVATDGSVALPSELPPGVEVEVRPVAGPEAAQALRTSLPEGTVIVAADVVRPANDRFDGGIRVTDEASRHEAEEAVFAEILRRGELGLVARHLNKPISIRITRGFLCELPITPNQVTVAAGAIGLLGCMLIAQGGYASALAGFALTQLQSILDGCDGELARVRFEQSRFGEWLDTIVDDALNACITMAVGIGLARAGGTSAPAAVGILGAALFATYSFVTYRELMRAGLGGDPFRLKWWFARGDTLKTASTQGLPGGMGLLMIVSRRDVYVMAWLVLALLDLRGAILAWAFLLAFGYFGAAVVQLALRRR